MEEKKNIRIILEYDGTAYHGWQSQKNGLTIQDILEEKIGTITNREVRITGSGRTDAGVHALHQVCNFFTESHLEPLVLKEALNSILPDDIHIKAMEYVHSGFHSRYDVKSKLYEYRVWNRKEPNIFLRHYTWHIKEPLRIDEMIKCLGMLIGTHDFSCFRSSGSSNINPVRNMIRAEITDQKNGLLLFRFESAGFLRHMVRNIMGTLMDAGRGRMNSDDFKAVLMSKDRRNAGIKSPAQGLFLVMVNY